MDSYSDQWIIVTKGQWCRKCLWQEVIVKNMHLQMMSENVGHFVLIVNWWVSLSHFTWEMWQDGTWQLLTWAEWAGIILFNSSPPGQNGRHFADDVLKCIFVNENCCVLIEISLKYVCKVPINNNPALVQIMAWRWTGDKPLSEPMLSSLDAYMWH